jgi:hypothetical protein
MTDHDSTNRGRCDESNLLVTKLISDGPTELFSLLGVLKYQRTLQILLAVQSTGENEVTFE